MSLLARNAGLMLLSTLLIFSCKEKEQIGVQPQDNTVGVFFTDTLSIKTSASIPDSIDTGNEPFLFVGAYKDDIFGDVNAEAYAQLIPKDQNVNLSGANIDSVYLNLEYNYYYGDTTQTQTINVFKISDTENLGKDSVYFSNHHSLALSNQYAAESFNLRPAISSNVFIKMDKTFGNDIAAIIGSGKTNAEFQNLFKGIALIPGDKNSGSVVRFNLSNNTSKIIIYYNDSLTYNLLINRDGANFSRIVRSSLTPPIEDKLDLSGKAYVQSLPDVRTKIEFPTLKRFKDSLGNKLGINRAELIFEIDPATISPLLPNSYLYLIKLNKEGEPREHQVGSIWVNQEVQEDFYYYNGTDVPQYAYFNKAANTYTFNLSTYFHAMLNDLEPNNGLLLAGDKLFVLNRVKANSVKLRVYYTKVE